MPPTPAPAAWRARIFAASWISYFSYYFTRMPFKAAKTTLQADYGLTKSDLNHIDTAYNIAYCVGQISNGFLTDWLGPRRWVALGMLVSATMAFVFQLQSSFGGIFVGLSMLLWGINGFAQSTGWNGNGKLMASWFGSKGRGEVMGLWSTCYQAGGLVATLVAARLLMRASWEWVFIGPAIWVAVIAIGFYLLVRDRPSDVGYVDPDVAAVDAAERKRLVKAAWPVVLRNPMVWAMGGAYFACKLIRYALLFWLPFYLSAAFGYGKGTALDMSMAFDGGGILFVVLAGYLADRVFGRYRVATAFGAMILLIGAIFLYSVIGDVSAFWNVVGLLLIGGCLFAADSLISGAVAQDLGGPHAAALATGLINGIGSIGQVVQGFLLVWISDAYGWDVLLYVFAGVAALGAVCLVPFLGVRPAAPVAAAR